MTRAARDILEAASAPCDMDDDELKRLVWGLAKIQPLILDRLDDLNAHNKEQDEYIFVFKLSWCAVRWVLVGQNRKYVIALIFLILNAAWTLAYLARCWT
jgi:hypothetical protein